MGVKELDNHPNVPDFATIWRYLSLPQFLAILSTNKLHFSRVSSFPDEFEGTLPKPTIEALKKQASEHENMDHNDLLERYKKYNQFVYANCWSIKDRPSSVMWRAYADFESGIAIKSEYEMFYESLGENEDSIWIGRIKYIDHMSDPIPVDQQYRRYFYKNKVFSEERELRAIISDPPIVYPEHIERESGKHWVAFSESEEMPYIDFENLREYDLDRSKGVKVDVEKMIDRVCLSPGSGKWQKDTLEDTISDMGYNLTVEIADREPLH